MSKPAVGKSYGFKSRADLEAAAPWVASGTYKDRKGQVRPLVSESQLARPKGLTWLRLVCHPGMLPANVDIEGGKVSGKLVRLLCHTVAMFLGTEPDEVRVSLDTLCDFSGMNRRTVMRTIDGAERLGWLYVEPGSRGSGHSNRFRIGLPKTDPRLVHSVHQPLVHSVHQESAPLVHPGTPLVHPGTQLVHSVSPIGAPSALEDLDVEDIKDEAADVALPDDDEPAPYNPEHHGDTGMKIQAKVEALRQRLQANTDTDDTPEKNRSASRPTGTRNVHGSRSAC